MTKRTLPLDPPGYALHAVTLPDIATVYVVIEGGCVRYVSSTSAQVACKVIDLDDLRDMEDWDDEIKNDLAIASTLINIW